MNAYHRSRTKKCALFSSNVRQAHRIWGALSGNALRRLKELSERYSLDVAASDLQLLDNRWYVTHAGLLRIAHRHSCAGIRTILQKEFCSSAENRWVFKATVYKSSRSKGFVGYGDADPSNVSPLVRGAEMRVAETRAVNRALRKAYGIGLCSVEELGWTPRASSSPRPNHQNGSSVSGASGNGHSPPARLRDRLCLLIREHQLDPTLVKAYAADYCGTPALHNASREQVEAFINHLTERATNDRAALLCHLNSFAKTPEVNS
jgi:hypothetical protein